MQASHSRKRMPVTALTDPEDHRSGHRRSLRQAVPERADQEPRDVRGRGRRGPGHADLCARPDDGRRQSLLHLPDHPLAVVHHSLCQLCGGRRRGQGQGASRNAQADPRGGANLVVDEISGLTVPTPASELAPGQIVFVQAGELIPSDGEVIEGVASVNEAAITGESAPVVREAGGDRSAVTGGTLVVSDWLKVRITAAPGTTFLDRMIKLVEGAERQKTKRDRAGGVIRRTKFQVPQALAQRALRRCCKGTAASNLHSKRDGFPQSQKPCGFTEQSQQWTKRRRYRAYEAKTLVGIRLRPWLVNGSCSNSPASSKSF